VALASIFAYKGVQLADEGDALDAKPSPVVYPCLLVILASAAALNSAVTLRMVDKMLRYSFERVFIQEEGAKEDGKAEEEERNAEVWV